MRGEREDREERGSERRSEGREQSEKRESVKEQMTRHLRQEPSTAILITVVTHWP